MSSQLRRLILFAITSLIALGFKFYLKHLPALSGIEEGISSEIHSEVFITTAMIGLLLLGGHQLAEILSGWNLPRLTGYLLAGVAVGPFGLGLIHEGEGFSIMDYFDFIKNTTVSFIAFSAGLEIDIHALRKNGKRLLSFVALSDMVVFILVGSGVWIYFSGYPIETRLPIAIFLGILALASSPLIALATIEETGVKNHFSKEVLNIIVVKDIFILLLFSLAIPFFQQKSADSFILSELFHFLLSLILSGSVCGFIVGGLIAVYIKYIKEELTLFIVMLSFILTSICDHYHLETLIVGMSAGIFLRSFTPDIHKFESALRLSKVIIFALFFSMVGAKMEIDLVIKSILLLLMILALRCGGYWSGFRIFYKGKESVRQYGWTGIISQSGIALLLAIKVNDLLANQAGAIVKDLSLALIALSEIIGPVAMKWGILKSRYPITEKKSTS